MSLHPTSDELAPPVANPTTLSEFWALAERAVSTTQHLVDNKLRALETASLDELCRILIQYRWFTSYYAGDLAILVYKLPPSALRSELAEFLNEELGLGNPADTHPAMYDRFLMSLDVDVTDLERQVHPRSLELLDHYRRALLENSFSYGVGLKGMGAECLCQVYLQAMHHYLLKNPLIQARRDRIDWTFWNIHASEADQMHGERTRRSIERIAALGDLGDLARGYLDAERLWAEFWDNAHAAGVELDAPVLAPHAPIPSDGWRYDVAR